MGSIVLARHVAAPGISPNYPDASASHRAGTNDERLRVFVQGHFDGVRDFALGIGDRVSRIGKCVGSIFVVRCGGLALLPGDEFADGAFGAKTRAAFTEKGSD